MRTLGASHASLSQRHSKKRVPSSRELAGILAAGTILLASLVLLAWGSWPIARAERVHTIAAVPGEPQSDSFGWLATLDHPTRIRSGDAEVIRLTVQRGKSSLEPASGSSPALLLEARLDVAGVTIQPADVITEPLRGAASATFFWSVRATASDRLLGTLWLHTRTENAEAGGAQRTPIAALPVGLNAVSLLGLDGASARAVGMVGALLSLPLVVALASRRASASTRSKKA